MIDDVVNLVKTPNMVFEIQLTGAGNPALWESGGATTNNGAARIICGQHGQKIPAVLFNTYKNDKHALIKIQNGDHIIDLIRHRQNIEIVIYQITNIDLDNHIANVTMLYHFYNGEWDNFDKKLTNAVKAAILKSNDYRCNKAYYYIKNDKILKF